MPMVMISWARSPGEATAKLTAVTLGNDDSSVFLEFEGNQTMVRTSGF